MFRDVRTGQELVIPDTSMILELGEAAAALTATVLAANSPYPLELQPVIANIARRLLQPNLTFNKEETEDRKKQALEAVKPVFFQVKRGEMIIREGERVREEHIPRLRALASGKRSGDPVSAVVGTTIFVAVVVIFGLLYLRQLRSRVSWDSQSLLLLAVLLVGNILGVRAFMVVAQALGGKFPGHGERGPPVRPAGDGGWHSRGHLL